jgi:hypothetical protein
MCYNIFLLYGSGQAHMKPDFERAKCWDISICHINAGGVWDWKDNWKEMTEEY